MDRMRPHLAQPGTAGRACLLLALAALLVAGCTGASAIPSVPPSATGAPPSASVTTADPTAASASAPAPDRMAATASASAAAAPPIDAAALSGRWGPLLGVGPLDLLPSGDAYYTGVGQEGVTHDRWAITGGVLTLQGESCDGLPGTYRAKTNGAGLRLVAVDDQCATRRAVVAGGFMRAAEQLPWATATAVREAIAQPDYDLATVDAKGNVYQTDGIGGFYRYAPDGTVTGSWPGALTRTTGITTDATGDMYVASFDDATIHEFDPTGAPIRAWTVGGGKVGPVGLAHDAQGDIYVALHRLQAHHIEEYTPDGKLVAAWATEGSGDGELGAGSTSGPENLAVDAQGNVVVTDPVNARLVKFDAKRRFVADFAVDATSGHLGDVATDSRGNVYTLVPGELWRFDPTGHRTGRWFVPYGGALVIDGSDRIYLVDRDIAQVTLPSG